MSDVCQHRSLEEALQRLYPAGERRPNMVTLEFTRRCNFACGHCYCNLPANGPIPLAELTTEQWQRLISDAIDLGVLFALVTGGEPLLRHDFRVLWRALRQGGVVPTLFTNATLLDEPLADFLAEWTPRTVSVTLYGASEQTYAAMTGRPGMHEQALRGLELLRERGVSIDVKSMVTRRNVHEFPALREQSARFQEIFRWDAELLAAYDRGGGQPEQDRLSPAELVAVEATDPVRMAEWREMAAEWQPARPRPDTPFRCRVGEQDFVIDPYGFMHPCLGLDKVGINLVQEGMAHAWNRLPAAIAAVVGPPGPCQQCPLPPICRQCPADNVAECVPTGQPLPWRCELAQLRAQELNIPALAAGPLTTLQQRSADETIDAHTTANNEAMDKAAD